MYKDMRLTYPGDKLAAIREFVVENSAHFSIKYPVNIPPRSRIRFKNHSTCSNQGGDESTKHENDALGSKNSLHSISREQSDNEEMPSSQNAGWRRVMANRGKGPSQFSRQRFPSGSESNNDNNTGFHRGGHQQSWRQRTISGSDNQGRGGFAAGRGTRGGGSGAPGTGFFNNADSSFKSRGGRGRGFSRFLNPSENRFANDQNRNSYHAPGDANQQEEHLWDENDWIDARDNNKHNSGFMQESHGGILGMCNMNEKQQENTPGPESFYLYIDPLSNIQGPFSSASMFQWVEHNYLPDTLLVRRLSDPVYVTLQSMKDKAGSKNPFSNTATAGDLPESLLPLVPKKLVNFIEKFSPSEIETRIMNFTMNLYREDMDQCRRITDALLLLNMDEISLCISDEAFLRTKVLQMHEQFKTVQPPAAMPHVDLQNQPELDAVAPAKKTGKINFKKCAVNEVSGFRFVVDDGPMLDTKSPVLLAQMASQAELDHQVPPPAPPSVFRETAVKNDQPCWSNIASNSELRQQQKRALDELAASLKLNSKVEDVAVSVAQEPVEMVAGGDSGMDDGSSSMEKENVCVKPAASTKNQQPKSNANKKLVTDKQQPEPELEETPATGGWLTTQLKSNSSGKTPAVATENKKKKSNKKTSQNDSKNKAWQEEFDRRKKEQLEKRSVIEAEQTKTARVLEEQVKAERAVEEMESQRAFMALQKRDEEYRSRGLNLTPNFLGPPLPNTTLSSTVQAVTKPKVVSLADIQAEEEALLCAKMKEMNAGKAVAKAEKPTGWASVVSHNQFTAPAQDEAKIAKQPPKKKSTAAEQSGVAAAPNRQQAQTMPATETQSIWNIDTSGNAAVTTEKSKKSKNKKQGTNNNNNSSNGHVNEKEAKELRVWCQGQLANLPAINSAIDLPTVTGLLCDMEKSSEVLEFIETSFGSSKRVNKFARDFIQRREKLLIGAH